MGTVLGKALVAQTVLITLVGVAEEMQTVVLDRGFVQASAVAVYLVVRGPEGEVYLPDDMEVEDHGRRVAGVRYCIGKEG